MRIGVVLAESRGGIGQHVASLVPRFTAAGHRVVVCCPKETAEHFDFGGAEVVAEAGGLRGCDVVHAHGYKAGLAARGARLRPLVVTWHNAVLMGGVRGMAMRLGQRLVARAADLTLGASEDLVELARRYGAKRAELAPVAAPARPAAVRDRDTVRAELGLMDQVLVLSVGRLAPQKDYPTLLDVAARVPDVAYVVVGEGPLRDDLQSRILRDGLPVRLVGHRDDVPDLLAAADIFLLTSHWEARALVVQEAMQAGVPVVARPVGGIPELVGDDALLGADAAELAGQLRLLLSDLDLGRNLADGGLERAGTWPDEDQVAENLLDTYAGLVTSRP